MNLKQRIRSNQLTIGSWITIGHHSIVEIMSNGKFDWLAIDMEHSPISHEKCQELILAIQSKNISPLVRVSSNNSVEIKKAMDSGATGIIVPMIMSEKDVFKAINSIKYPPNGKRGVGLARAQDYGFGFQNYNKWQKNSSIVIAQIEHIEAVNNIEKIISINELDALIIGPYDLSSSMGYPGELNHKEVLDAINRIEEACRKKEFPFGFHIIEPDQKILKEKIRNGYNFLGFSLDFLFMGEKINQEMGNFRNE